MLSQMKALHVGSKRVQMICAYRHLCWCQLEVVEELGLDAGTIHTVLAVQKLHHCASACADGAIIPA